jgi:hypothetical protein
MCVINLTCPHAELKRQTVIAPHFVMATVKPGRSCVAPENESSGPNPAAGWDSSNHDRCDAAHGIAIGWFHER